MPESLHLWCDWWMNESFYVVVATIAPVLLFGTVLAFRTPVGGGRLELFVSGYGIVFALLGILGCTASFIGAVAALQERENLAPWMETTMFWSLVWLIAANFARIAGPYVEELYLLWRGVKLERLKSKNRRLSKTLEAAESRSEQLDAYIAVLEEQARAAGWDGRRKSLGPEKTRLLAKRK